MLTRPWSKVLAGLALLTVFPTSAPAERSADGLWVDVPEQRIADTRIEPANPRPLHYRVLRLDLAALGKLLPAGPAANSAVTVSLPYPDGGFAQFSLRPVALMAPGLAARYPEIRTYRGAAVGDPALIARLSLTAKGLRGFIRSGSGTFYIDPYQRGDSRHYLSYAAGDAVAAGSPPRCEIGEHFPDRRARSQPSGSITPISNGERLRTYKIAIAATGEYTVFHGGTVQDGLGAVVDALNRVDEIYRQDAAIAFELVSNNDDVIFTDPATDPYTGGIDLLEQNQVALDSEIGSFRYDIGHVFTSLGGAVALLGSTCESGGKAQGTSGSFEPINDPFWVDFVAHELGHQFNAEHTFNGELESCGGGNRSASTAYEPGSGTTIMAYAGICGAQNVQFNSDPYFHAISVQQIVDYSVGTSGNCADRELVRNDIPSVDAGPDNTPAYTIPKETPFELTATGDDPDDDSLTFTWEQFDLGAPGFPDESGSEGPTFRSFPPSSNPTRVFPQIDQILGLEVDSTWEVLPSQSSRDLTFIVTARDGRGGINQDIVELRVNSGRGPFAFTSPISGTPRWDGFDSREIRWREGGTRSAPISCGEVDVSFSTDGGRTFPISVLKGTPNDGRQDITVPNVDTDQGRLKLKCSSNVFFDISAVDIRVRAGTAPSESIHGDHFETPAESR